MALKATRWSIESAADRLLSKRRAPAKPESESEEEEEEEEEEREGEEEEPSSSDEEEQEEGEEGASGGDGSADEGEAETSVADCAACGGAHRSHTCGKSGGGKAKPMPEAAPTAAEPAAAPPAEEAEDTQSWRPTAWEVGYLCDGQDQYRSPWCVAKIIAVEEDRVKVHHRSFL